MSKEEIKVIKTLTDDSVKYPAGKRRKPSFKEPDRDPPKDKIKEE